VRLGAVLALRRLERAEIAVFLKDSDEAIVLEAARAINDLPISGAIGELAALIGRDGVSPSLNPRAGNMPALPQEPLLRRVLAANFRYGTKHTAEALARFAAMSDAPEAMR